MTVISDNQVARLHRSYIPAKVTASKVWKLGICDPQSRRKVGEKYDFVGTK